MAQKQELFAGRLTYVPGQGAFPLSTDSMVLGSFVRLPRQASVADLGSGSGVLGLLLCGKHPDCTVTGLEISPEAHDAALANIARNSLDVRLMSSLCSVKDAKARFAAGSFTTVVSNPPYFTAGPGTSTARKELEGTLEDFFACAAWLVRFGGDFFLVHRPERLTDLLALGRQYRLEPKELRFVRHNSESAPSLVLLSCRKGAKSGLKLLPDLVLHHPDGSPTDEYRSIYSLD